MGKILLLSGSKWGACIKECFCFLLPLQPAVFKSKLRTFTAGSVKPHRGKAYPVKFFIAVKLWSNFHVGDSVSSAFHVIQSKVCLLVCQRILGAGDISVVNPPNLQL